MTGMTKTSAAAKESVVTYILVYGSLRTGGIETLIVRMAHYLIRKGVPVLVCCGDGALLSALPDLSRVITYSGSQDLRKKLSESRGFLDQATNVIIVSFDPISAARALFVELLFSRRIVISHLSGVFHPRAYFMTGKRKDWVILNNWVARAVGYPYLFFMNNECRDGHAERWRTDLSQSPIVTLPIDVAEPSWLVSTGAPLRIVSVGRLVDFKAYNLGAPGLIRALRQRGVDVLWDIYGDGPLRDEIAEEIERCGVREFVCLRGELPYRDFSATVAAYDVFIGVGTAALEAAMLGVPTICGTDSHRELCYGFLYELPYGNVGELQLHPPEVELQGLIEDFSHSDPSVRTALSERCRAAAMRYEMGSFIDQLMDVHRAQPRKTGRAAKRLVAWLYLAATESAVIGVFRRIFRGRPGMVLR